MALPSLNRDRFQMVQSLGVGGMGQVYLAFDRERGEQVALKFLLAPLEASGREFFREEVKLLSQLSHPNLIRIFDFFDGSSSYEGFPAGPFFSMEFIEGLPLNEAGKNFVSGQWIDLTAQLSQGLSYLHSRNVLHRDLKPSNILIDKKGEPRILDFGLSTPLSGAKPSSKAMGTLVYMPPEAFWGDYGATGDLFSLGVLLYECLSGRFPFPRPFYPPGRPMPPPSDLKKFRPDLPSYFRDLIHRLLEISPYRRPPSASSVLRYINQHVETPYRLLEEESAEAVLRKVPLVGRERELRQFRDAFASAKKTSRPVVLQLEGPTGVGRSRLVDEMKWKFQIEGVPFAFLSPDEAREWIDRAGSRLGLESSQDTASDLIGRMRAILRMSERRASVLVFGDLHDWPAESLRELRMFLAIAEESHSSLLLILETNTDLPASELLLSLRAAPATRIALPDLTAEQSFDLLAAATPDNPIEKRLAVAIVAASGGRPLLILESLRHVLSEPGKIAPGDFQVFSKSLQDVTTRRVSPMSERARSLLALLVVHPDPLAVSHAEELLGGETSGFEAAFLELYRQGFVAGRDAQNPAIRLAQVSLRQAYIEAMDAEIILQSHRKWISWLKPRVDAAATAGREMVWLVEHAWLTEDSEILRLHGVAAADFLAEHGEEAKSVEWYRKLLAFARTSEERYVLNGSQAPVLYRLGRFEEALEAYDRWFEDRTDDESLLQKTKHRFFTGLVLYAAGRDAQAHERFEEAIAISDSGRFPDLRLYHTRARAFLAALEEKKENFEAAKRHLHAGLSLAAGDPMLLGEIEQRLGKVEQREFHQDAARAHYEKSLRDYRQAGNPQSEAVAMQNLAMLDLQMGRVAEATELSAQAVDLSKKNGQILQTARGEVNRALVFLAAADYGSALEAIDAGRQVLEVLGTEENRLLMEIYRADLFLRLGNLDRSDRLFQKLLSWEADLRRVGFWGMFLFKKAEGFYLYGKISQAEELFTAGLQAVSPTDWAARRDGLLGLCRCLAQRGKLPETPRVLRQFLAIPSEGNLDTVWNQTLRWLSLPRGETPEARRFQELLSFLKSMEMPEVRLDIYRLLAQDLQRRGMAESFQKLREKARQEWTFIYGKLPEELKMDFEKNRRPESLDQAFSEMLDAPPGPATMAPEIRNEPVAGGLSEQRFRQYCEINRRISQRHDLAEVLERVMDAALELTGAERGFLLLKNEAAKEKPLVGYEIKTARGLNQRSLQQDEFKFSMSAIKQAMEEGAALLTSDALSDDRLQSKKSVVLYQLKAILVMPLEFEGHVQGAIYLDHRSRPGCFNQESVALIGALAVQAALAIQKAQMIEDLQRSNRSLSQEVQTLSAELNQVRDQLRYGYEEIVGKSQAMMQVFQLLDHVTETAIPVWILGESGTGKELIARSLHFNSARKEGPFVTENCSAIPETLLESELFGHKKGAFTHADRDRVGLFEQADNGTLFLDEVADMSLAMQAKLLRVLQEGEVRPVGSGKKVKVDVRLVTASNRDLEYLVQEGKFRQDLFYRINGMTIPLPPLRERREDIPLLVSHLVEKISRDFKLKPSELSDGAFQLLIEHSWPGNIRELEAVIRNALLFAKGRPITPEVLALTKTFKTSAKTSASASAPASPTARTEQEEERQMIIEALRRNKLNKRMAAEEMGVSLRSLYFRMERHGIPKNKPVLAKFLGLKD